MDSKRSSEAEHTVRLMQAVDRIDAERKVADAEITRLRTRLEQVEQVVEAAKQIRWNDVGKYNYMESPDIYKDLARLQNALFALQGARK